MTQATLTCAEQNDSGYGTRLSEEEYKKRGLEMEMEARMELFLFTLSSMWDRFPQDKKRGVVNFAGFVGYREKLILKTPWNKIPHVNRNLIAIAVIQIKETGDAFTCLAREALA